ncbi:MAG: glycine cleavage system aminomethyltransferase GcvT [Elusimicrobia bacterium]|nr:glycine cleavage system aminomethyltransferase GcvT [Elusimicrobiota bacterium]
MNTAEAARRTALYGLHRSAGGKMVDFHGWELPVQYSSVMREHHAVRRACGIFDVSHMGQVEITGPDALAFLQKVNSNDAARLQDGGAMYSHLLNERGGVVDDVIFSRLGPKRFFMVVNAATADKDFAWLLKQAEGLDVEVENRSDYFGMIAVQGPLAARILSDIVPEAEPLKRFGALELELYGRDALITRTGYTGEDGFEVIVPNEISPRIWETLRASGASYGLLPCGLGARDTLRLEAGYLLYGSDIDNEHTPLEAGYGWVVKFSKEDFIGKAALEKQKREGLRRKLLGLRLSERGVPRAGAPVRFGEEQMGVLCSATFSPTLQAGIGVGYLSQPGLAAGAKVSVELHGRRIPAEIVPVPFYKSKSLGDKK